MRWEKITIAVLSILFALIIYLLLPIETHKYSLRIEAEETFNKVIAILYADLDGDRSIEMVRCKNDKPVPSIVVHKEDGEVIEHWNLNGDWMESLWSGTREISAGRMTSRPSWKPWNS